MAWAAAVWLKLGSSADVVGAPGGWVLGNWELSLEGTGAEGAGGGTVDRTDKDEGDEATSCWDRVVGDCHTVAGTLAPRPPKLCSSGVRAEGTPPAVEESPGGERSGSVPCWLGAGLVIASSVGSEVMFLGSGVGVAAVLTGSPKAS